MGSDETTKNFQPECDVCGTRDKYFARPRKFDSYLKRGPKLVAKMYTIFLLENGSHACNGKFILISLCIFV